MTSPGFPTKYTQLWAHTKAGDVLDDDTTYPAGVTAESPLEEVLQASLEGAGGGGGGIASVVEDLTPQLGGDLDLNGNVITGLEIGIDVQAEPAGAVTVAGDDKVVIRDTSDADSVQTVTAQSIANLGGGGGGLASVPNGRRYAPGGTYLPLLGLERTSTADGFGSTGDSYFLPFFIGGDITISELSVEVYNAGTTSQRKIAIFTDDNGKPDALVANSDIEVDTSALALVTTALAANITLTAGNWYWVGTRADPGGSGGLIRSFDSNFGFQVGMKSLGTSLHSDGVAFVRESVTTSYAAFPPATVGAIIEGSGSLGSPIVVATLV